MRIVYGGRVVGKGSSWFMRAQNGSRCFRRVQGVQKSEIESRFPKKTAVILGYFKLYYLGLLLSEIKCF